MTECKSISNSNIYILQGEGQDWVFQEHPDRSVSQRNVQQWKGLRDVYQGRKRCPAQEWILRGVSCHWRLGWRPRCAQAGNPQLEESWNGSHSWPCGPRGKNSKSADLKGWFFSNPRKVVSSRPSSRSSSRRTQSKRKSGSKPTPKRQRQCVRQRARTGVMIGRTTALGSWSKFSRCGRILTSWVNMTVFSLQRLSSTHTMPFLVIICGDWNDGEELLDFFVWWRFSQGQSAMNDVLRELHRKMDEIIGRQERSLSVLTAIQVGRGWVHGVKIMAV